VQFALPEQKNGDPRKIRRDRTWKMLADGGGTV
jgi:hypothetical protein